MSVGQRLAGPIRWLLTMLAVTLAVTVCVWGGVEPDPATAAAGVPYRSDAPIGEPAHPQDDDDATAAVSQFAAPIEGSISLSAQAPGALTTHAHVDHATNTATSGLNAEGGVGATPYGPVNSGNYVVSTPAGEYVGQSSNISQRLAQHVANGKFTQAEVDLAQRFGVQGTKLDREIAEQLLIDSKGGIDKPVE